MSEPVNWIADIDLAQCFDTMPHVEILAVLSERIADQNVANQVTERTALHRAHLADHITPFDPHTTQVLKGLTGMLFVIGLPLLFWVGRRSRTAPPLAPQ
jgi:hypothetical protein